MTDIAVQCELILENPNKGVTRRRNEISPLNAVVRYLDDENPQIRILATLSLMKVFNDILPVSFLLLFYSIELSYSYCYEDRERSTC